MAAKRRARLPRLSSPRKRDVAAWVATLRDLMSRATASWPALVAGWEHDHPTKTARADSTGDSLKRVRLRTFDTLDANEQALEEAAETTASTVDRYCSTELRRVFGIPSSSLVPPKILSGFRDENVSLVRSMAGEELDTLTDLLTEADAKGLRVESVQKMIEERIGVVGSRAELIARDQVLKLNGQISRHRQEAAGITQYVWNTTSDDRVRPFHEELHGTTQTWGDPPITSPRGDRNEPGSDYQCRCVAIPILPWLEGEAPEE